MPVSSLVLTLTDDHSAPTRVVNALKGHSHIETGEPIGARLPLVLDTPDIATDRAIFEALRMIPDVTSVELAFMDFSDVPRTPMRELRKLDRPRRNKNQNEPRR